MFPGKIAVGIDAKSGKVAIEGWAEVSKLSVTELALRLEDAGIAAIIYTDIARDGMLTAALICRKPPLWPHASACPVIASGGVAGLVRHHFALQMAAAAATPNLCRRHHRPRPLRWQHRS